MNPQKVSILSLLSGSDYRTYNIHVAKYLGSVNAAILFSELIGKFKYHSEKNELINDTKYGDGWFYHTHESIQERTGLSRKEVFTAFKILEKANFIEKKLIGLPARNHFKFKNETILAMLDLKIKTTSCTETVQLEVPKGDNSESRKGTTAHIIDKPKEEHKDNSLVATKVAMSADADEILSFFIQKLKERQPDFKFPSNLKKWAQEIDRMIRIDKRDPKKIKAMIEWIHQNSFWSTTVLSTKKLRDQYDNVSGKMNLKAGNDEIQKNKTYAIKMKSKYRETYKNLIINEKFILNSSNEKELSLNLPYENFKREFVHLFGIRWDDLSPTDQQ